MLNAGSQAQTVISFAPALPSLPELPVLSDPPSVPPEEHADKSTTPASSKLINFFNA
jgi:hypothetical protein